MAVGAALSHLGRAGYIERFDIPGKRMRGTRLLRPDILARHLEIDAAALREKDRRDRAKLKAMVELCYATRCRQEMILDYFGEPDAAPCGTCDICRTTGVQPPRDGTAEEITVVRQILSGVARMSSRHADGTWEGRYGKGRIIQMLVGSRSQEILNAGLDQLTTYGLLKQVGSSALHPIFQEIERQGLLETSEGEYPLVSLTAKGIQFMKVGGCLRMRWPDLKAGERSGSGNSRSQNQAIEIEARELGFDDVLFEKLKRLRNALAQSEGVPAYRVFGNQTLEFFTRLKPTTLEAGRKIRGVGDQKAAQYLPEFVKLIAAHDRH